MTNSVHPITTGIAWCLAWGDKREPQFELSVLQQMRQALNEGKEVPEEVRSLVEQAQQLQAIPKDYFPKTLTQLQNDYPGLWQQSTPVGLIYGGATKIKTYVFEVAQLPDIRGASALLDRINLIDLPAFFGKDPKDSRYQLQCQDVRTWLDTYFSDNTENLKLSDALIPELIIYSTGGNILAFCPSAYVHNLANAIEKRYTQETLTANSCAVGDTFRLLEIRFGLLQNPIENTPWLDWYQRECENSLLQAYFGSPDTQNSVEKFQNRKNFNELVSKLAARFNQRRNGNDLPNVDRSSRRYPPMFETHPYLQRDESERRLAVSHATEIPEELWFSETLARKRLMGDKTKREVPEGKLPKWYKQTNFKWQPGEIESWVSKFERFLEDSNYRCKYYQYVPKSEVKEARSLTEIGNASSGFVAYIYADGNNMGGYIQKKIQTPGDYQVFSDDVSKATEEAVYEALSQHLNPQKLEGMMRKEHQSRNGLVIHPFEILTIGGDDVLLIVPANKALAVAKTIGEAFETQLVNTGRYKLISSNKDVHRYQGGTPPEKHCELSISTGILITAYSTPIYYAQKLYEQLLKSAKQKAKDLKKTYHYSGGTLDFLTLKSVTMISSNVKEFREQGLTKYIKSSKFQRYAAPYTLHELSGLIEATKALKASDFPRSQLYQIRSFLEQGKQTAILNYRYFRTRLKGREQQNILKTYFEEPWCKAKSNEGNIAPWMYREKAYETIWQDLVDLYPFIDAIDMESASREPATKGTNS
jgi:CRISPR-associated protein Cmr2